MKRSTLLKNLSIEKKSAKRKSRDFCLMFMNKDYWSCSLANKKFELNDDWLNLITEPVSVAENAMS